nr:MAG TPA_asm: hypothetical protein [Caudoviricetes sp.]
MRVGIITESYEGVMDFVIQKIMKHLVQRVFCIQFRFY